jgi:hypothetical protein
MISIMKEECFAFVSEGATALTGIFTALIGVLTALTFLPSTFLTMKWADALTGWFPELPPPLRYGAIYVVWIGVPGIVFALGLWLLSRIPLETPSPPAQ